MTVDFSELERDDPEVPSGSSRKKQIAEKLFRDALKNTPLWNHRMQNIGYTTTPADYMVMGETHVHLVECKETVDTYIYPQRLTQLDDLIRFTQACPKIGQAWFFIYYRKHYRKDSLAFLIPAGDIQDLFDSGASRVDKEWCMENYREVDLDRIEEWFE